MLLDELGGRVRARRERLGLKQVDIANALQVSPQAVSKWERGENAPDITILGALASLLGVSIDWLLDAGGSGRDVFEATVFASNVSGACEKSALMEPRDYAAWVNGIFSQVTEAVMRHDGVPVKYVGDGFLSFFSGANHAVRAVRAAGLAKEMACDELRIGLNSGDIYLGAVGHPDYARSDIMGEVVNTAFRTLDWAESNSKDGVAATMAVAKSLPAGFDFGPSADVEFKGIANPVEVVEIRGWPKQNQKKDQNDG